MKKNKDPKLTFLLIRWFWIKYFKKYFFLIFIATVFMAIEGSMVGLLSYSVKILFDDVFLSNSTQNIVFVGLLIFGIFSLRAFSGFIQGFITSFVVQKINKFLQSDLTQHLIRMDVSFFGNNSPGILIERVRVDSQKITDLCSNILMTLGRDGISLFSLLVVACWIDWKWTIIAFVGAPILVLPILVLQKWIRKVALKSREVEANITVKLDELFHGIKEIKINNIQNDETNKINKLFEYIRNIKFKLEVGLSGMPAIIDFIAAFGFLGVMIFGGREIIEGKKTVGEFMSFFTAMALTFEPLRRLSSVSGNFQVALASIEKVYNLFRVSPEIKNVERSMLIPISKISNGINLSFNKVNFSYGNHKVINDLSFDIKYGQKVAFVGASGAGKTTILNLLLRLIEPKSGNIFINNKNINKFEINELRNLFAVVSQESILFDDTIKENIIIGDRKASTKNIDRVLKDALINEFLSDLPEGIDTKVGPRGTNLSGGQKQRVLIARAMLKNAFILVMDEPTSALDGKSEVFVQKALDRLSLRKTSITIAHKISSVVNADKIYVMNSGKIIEQGSHQELFNKKGFYRDLALSQSYDT